MISPNNIDAQRVRITMVFTQTLVRKVTTSFWSEHWVLVKPDQIYSTKKKKKKKRILNAGNLILREKRVINSFIHMSHIMRKPVYAICE